MNVAAPPQIHARKIGGNTVDMSCWRHACLESYYASSANGCAVRWRICRGGVFPTVRDVA